MNYNVVYWLGMKMMCISFKYLLQMMYMNHLGGHIGVLSHRSVLVYNCGRKKEVFLYFFHFNSRVHELQCSILARNENDVHLI